MKKLLALVLALVMTLGLATVGTNAALSDFSDASDVSNEEAMAVMNAVGVFVGSDGKLDPKGGLTRAAAAKLVAYLALGEDIAEALPKTGSKFADVPDGAWYTGYVNYMVNEGYTTGTGANTFSPDDQLNGYQFGAFLLAVLGYDRNLEGMAGSGWETKVAVKLEELGLTKNVDKLGSANLTREEAAQFCLNALKADCVEYSDKGTSIDINGAKITTGAKAATKVAAAYTTNNNKKTDNVKYNSVSDQVVQLAEKLYKGDLTLKTAEVTDGFGRAAHAWYWKGVAAKNKVGTYADSADYTYVVTSTSKTANLLAVINELGVDAATATKNTFKGVSVALGDVVEIYTDSNDLAESYIIFKTVLGQVTKVAASNSSDYAYTVTLKTKASTKTYKDTELTGFDAATMTKDTYVTVTTVANKSGIEVAVANKTTGKVTGYGDSYVMIDKVKTSYNTNKEACWKIDNATYDYDNTFDFYTDANGYVIGVEKVTDVNTIDNIFFVSEANFKAGSSFANNKAQLKVYYLDGKTEVVDMVIDSDKKIDVGGTKKALPTDEGDLTGNDKVAGNFYAYTLDGQKIAKITKIANGVVENTAQDVTADDKVTFESKSPTVAIGTGNGTKYYANSSTKVAIIDQDGKITTITGYRTLPGATYTVKPHGNLTDGQAEGILYVADGTTLKEVYIVAAHNRIGAEDDAVYGYFVSKSDPFYDADEKATVYTLTFNVNGENKEYSVKSNVSYEGLYEIEVKDGFVDTASGKTKLVTDSFKKLDSVGDGYVVVGGKVIKLADSCAIYDATDAKNITSGELNDGDIVSYTQSDSKINRIYVGYADPDDGMFAAEDSAAFAAYLTVNNGAIAASNFTAQNNLATEFAALEDNGRVVKFALDKKYENETALSVVVNDADGHAVQDLSFGNNPTVTGAKGDSKLILFNVSNLAVGDYDIVIGIGQNNTVATYSFSVDA